MRPYFKKTHYKKRAGGVAQGVRPEFKPQYYKKKIVLVQKKISNEGSDSTWDT
jgi:hypothetical protein